MIVFGSFVEMMNKLLTKYVYLQLSNLNFDHVRYTLDILEIILRVAKLKLHFNILKENYLVGTFCNCKMIIVSTAQ